MVNVTPRPLYPRERDPVPIVYEAGWAPGAVWTGAENLASHWGLIPGHTARSDSLYRLSRSGPQSFNRLRPNDPYMGRTAPLTSKRCILYVYSTSIGTEYFKHALYSPFFSSKCSLFHNANLFGSCIIHILYTGCAKIKKNISCANGLKLST